MYDVVQPFPCRGRKWVRYEDQFLEDWLNEFGLDECARQLGRTPASVALRCAWLGIRKPKQAEAESKPEAQTPVEAPERPVDAKGGTGACQDKGKAKGSDSGASSREIADSAGNGPAGPERKAIVIELPKAKPEPAPAPLTKAASGWSPEEDAKLMEMRKRGVSYANCAAALFGRTANACSNRAQKLAKPETPKAPSRAWSNREIAVLRENWPKMPARDIAALLPGRSLKAVYWRAELLHLGNAYSRRRQGTGAKPGRKRQADRPGPAAGKRRCHDCGKPTPDYRCPKCWEKIRGRIALDEDGI